MFEKQLEEKFQKIFGVQKVTFDAPGESQEQGCLFIEIEDSRNTIKDGRELAKVTGNAVMFARAEQIPFGFFSKAIAQANPADTKDLFFFDFEVNTRRYRDKVQRGFSFVYFFGGQYDPETGSINEVTISVEDENA